MPSHELRLNHPSQLKRLSTLPVRRQPGIARLRLEGAISESPQAQAWERDLNRAYFACGCAAAAAGLLLGLLLAAPVVAWALVGGARQSGATLGVAAIIVIAGALAGKLLGLLAAERRLRAVAEQIARAWPLPPGRVEVNAACG